MRVKYYLSKITGFFFTEEAKSVYFLVIASLVPIIRPQLISNTIIFDYLNGLFILFFLIHLLIIKLRLQIRLFIPMVIIFIGSILSMFNARVPLINSETLLVDLYLFLFFIVLYNVIETKKDLRRAILPWIGFAAFQGFLMTSNLINNFDIRHTGTFLNPNMAGNYLGISFFLLFQPFIKVGRVPKAIYSVLIIGGILASKSLSTSLSFLMGSLTVIVLYWMRIPLAKKVKLGLAVLVFLAVGVALFPKFMEIPNFYARLSKTVYGRSNLWKTGINIAIKNPLGMTIGPGAFETIGPIVKGPITKRRELHSDWLSFLVERGMISFFGLCLLFGTIARILFQSLKNAGSDREFLWSSGLLGMFVFIIVDSFSHEIFHYRHVWFVLAIMASQHKLQRRKAATE